MQDIKMRVIAESRVSSSTIASPGRRQGMEGLPHDIYLCGECGIILMSDGPVERVIRCNNCGSLNAKPGSLSAREEGASNRGRCRSGNDTDAQPVVVIDDEQYLLEMVCEALKMEGIPVLCLNSPQQIATLDEDIEPEMFLVDVMMPDISGIELAKELRTKRFSDTPMVAMSASREMLKAASASKLFDGALPKPFDLSVLVDTVHHYAA